MRKPKLMHIQKLIALLFCLSFLSVASVASEIQPGISITGLGTVRDAFIREIYPGINWTYINSENNAGIQKSHLIDLNYPESDIEVISSFGPYIYGGDRLSSLVRSAEENGYRVIYAINGDSYDTSTGVPKGIMIEGGILHHYSPAYKKALGYTNDRKVVTGSADFDIIAKTGDKNISVTYLNRDRKTNDTAVYLQTDRFSDTTRSKVSEVEVVLKGNSEGDSGVKIGSTIETTVVSVNNVQSGQATPIAKGHFVLSAGSKSTNFKNISGLKPGQNVKVTVINKSEDVDWSKVKSGIGIYMTLMENGNYNQTYYNTSDIHPRTSLLTMTNGKSQFMLNDGRRAGHAVGMRFSHMVDYAKSKSFPNLYNFDGGGSSTIYVTLPGDENATLLNRPSDGRERSNSNALLFVRPRKNGTSAQKLHIYGNGYSNSSEVFLGESINLTTKATDNSYNPVGINSEDINYTIEGNIGTVDASGKFTAGIKNGTGAVIAKHKPTGVSSRFDIVVNGTITGIEASKPLLHFAVNEKAKLEIYGVAGSRRVLIPSSLLNYEVNDSELGNVSSTGVFTAGSSKTKGSIKVSYDNLSVDIPVEVGKDPILLNSFERELAKDNWQWRFFNDNGRRGGSANASINTNPEYIKSGEGSLRIDYDFKTRPVTGVVAIEVGPGSGHGKLEGYPTAIGTWVYGDGSGMWLRMQLKPLDYIGEVHIDWTGWKYVEIPIPRESKHPYELVWGIRMVCEPDSAYNNTKGSLYFDDVSVLYGGNTDKPDICEINRIYGADRFKTATEISKTYADAVDTVILANAHNYPDALAGAPLAGIINAPILITNADNLPEDTLTEIQRLSPTNILLLGGENSISERVAEKLSQNGYEVKRISGSNRYQTALEIAMDLRERHATGTICIASGENYPDALALTPVAISQKSPILLSGRDTLDPYVKQAIMDWGIEKIVIAGGPSTISAEVEQELKALGSDVIRLYGDNRYDTAVNIARSGLTDIKSTFITDGSNFVDALTAGPLAGKNNAAILLTSKTELPGVVKTYLKDTGIKDIMVIGGPSSVSDLILDNLCNMR